MKFKLLHVRPHVWFFKQKETISKPTSNDDTSSSEGGAYVYKRSTSLKLVKSNRVAGRACKPLHASKSSSTISKTGLRPHAEDKDVKVCTVVDAGCTCRATLTSQHKAQKKGLGAYAPNAANGSLGSLHDVCRPRWAPHVLEVRGEDGAAVDSRHDVCRPRRRVGQLNPKRAASASNVSVSTPLGTSNSVMSRLVCKSSQDVVKTHTELFEVEHCDVVSKLANSTESEYARASYAGDEKAVTAGLDVHQLECRLRNAGLEEQRRRSKKASKYYEEGSSTGVSSTTSTIYSNTDSLITRATTEMQDMLLNANPAFDTDGAPSTGDSMLSLEDLRASIEQRKLANLQTSLCGKGDGMRENAAASTCSPSSLSSGNTVSACCVSPLRVQNPMWRACEEDSFLKHTNVGVSKKLYFSECKDVSNQGVPNKQSPRKACVGTFSARKEAVRDEYSRLPRKALRRIDLSAQKGSDAQKKGSVSRVKGEVHEAPKMLQEVENRSDHRSFARPELGHICAGAATLDETGQAEKQGVSSSSCEIQILSDCNFDHHSDGNHTYPIKRVHVNGALSTGAASHVQGAARSLQAKFGTVSSAMSHESTTAAIPPTVDASEPSSQEHELMQSESAVAMVKSSYDPKLDFKESMLEMVMAKRLRTPRQLQQLLQCYLSLNPSYYHPTIIKVFHELCSELFN